MVLAFMERKQDPAVVNARACYPERRMGTIRRRLRPLIYAWLLCQALFLSALVPLACCENERPAAKAAACHREIAAKQCPMRAADGRPCPMHADSSSSSNTVTLGGMCSPMDAALVAVLLQPAVPLAPYHVDAAPAIARLASPPEPQELSLLTTPETPPPRV